MRFKMLEGGRGYFSASAMSKNDGDFNEYLLPTSIKWKTI